MVTPRRVRDLLVESAHNVVCCSAPLTMPFETEIKSLCSYIASAVMSFRGRIMWRTTCDQGFFFDILCPFVHMPNYSWSAWSPLKIDPGSVPCACLFPLKDERSYPELEDSYQLQTRVHVGRKGTAWRKVSNTTALSEYAILKLSLKKLQIDKISGTEEGNMSQTRAHRLSLTTRKFSSSGAHTFSPWQKCFPLPNPGWYTTSESFTIKGPSSVQ